ncbi:AEC family transporter [Malonomonas rubra]|uniref:AEC family transporter n=1 Tax=Malonomonas rubra TaxID=57040 RepID=UPI0026EABECD|nr:AEC family transporter [Malonomonas rubra]
MSLLIDTLTIVLPVFLVIALGQLLTQLRLFDASFVQQTNRLVYIVFLPLLLFHKIGKADFATFFNGPLVIASSLVIVTGFLLTYFYTGLRNYPAPKRGSFCQGSFRGNLAYVGLAICLNAYGDEGLTRGGILMGFLVPVLNLFAIFALLLPYRSNADEKQPNWLAQVAFNPLIIASFLGIIWSYWHLPLPVIIDRALNITTGITLPMALLAIGGSFSMERIKGDLRIAGLATMIKLTFLPIFAAILLSLFKVRGIDFGIGILMAGTPTATATYIMAHQLKGDAELAGSIVMLSTLCSAISYTIILFILKGVGL